DPASGVAMAPTMTVRPGVEAILAALSPSPAYVLNRVSDMVAANPEGLALFHGVGDWPRERRNTVRYIFTHPVARSRFADWDATARASVAQLRSRNAHCPSDPHLLDLVAEVSGASDAFERLWTEHAVGPRRHTTKSFRHPSLGAVTFDFESLHLPD